MTKACVVLGVALLLAINVVVECNPRAEIVFDVKQLGAKANGKINDAMAIIRAWNDVCASTVAARLLIPAGEYKTGEIVFAGPCAAQKPIIIEIQGTLLADTDLSTYTQGAWIMVENVDGVVITGEGTINGRGHSNWEYADENAPPLAVSMRLQNVTNVEVNTLNFVDSMGFQIKVENSDEVSISNLKITAPVKSPFTDGVYLINSTNVKVVDSVIGTGGNCVSVHNSSQSLQVSGLSCPPGHGVSFF